MLDALDLGRTEQTLYEALVDHPAMTEAELGTVVSVDRRQLPALLESLEERGLLSRVPGVPVRFTAVAPEIALEALLLEREHQLQRARGYTRQLAARFQQPGRRRDPAELVEIVSGRRAIRQRSEQLQRGVRHEFRGVDKPPYTVDAIDSASGPPVEAEMLRAGVRYRVIYDTSGLASIHGLRSDLEEGMVLGEQARVLSNTPTKLMIFDDRMAMIPLEPASASLVSMIVVHPSGLLEALCSLFEDLWRRALPLVVPEAAPSGAPDDPTPDELRLLNLLATGMPDNAIAKHLGISHRTLQRRLRALLDRLDSSTRFQAGLQAAARGWLSRT